MSIQIGVTSASVTSRERLILESSVESNMIVIKSPTLRETNIQFDNGLTIGRSNQVLQISKNKIPIASFNSNETIIHSPFILNNTFSTNRNQEQLFGKVTACNIEVIPIGNANNIFNIKKNANESFVNAFTDGTLLISGNLGIGTYPVSNYALHVSSNVYFGKTLYVHTIQDTDDDNKVILKYTDKGLNQIGLMGNVFVGGDIQFGAGVTFDKLVTLTTQTIQNRLDANVLVVTNNTSTNIYSQSNSTLRITHDWTKTKYNALDVYLAGSSNSSLSVGGSNGYIGIGTNNPDAILHVKANLPNSNVDILRISESNNLHNIIVNNAGLIGIGTTLPLHALHFSDDTSFTNSYIGFYDYTSNQDRLFITGYSNETKNIQLTSGGTLALGNIPLDTSWNIDVSCNIRTKILQTNKILSDPLLNEVSFEYNNVSNITNLFSTNAEFNKLTSCSNLITNYFFTSNFSIVGLNIFNTDGFFSITAPSSLITASNIFMSQKGDINDLFANPISEGKLRINADLYDKDGNLINNNTNPNIGLHVYGSNYVGLKISASNTSSLYLAKPHIEGSTIFLNIDDQNKFNIRHVKNINSDNYNILSATNDGLTIGNILNINREPTSLTNTAQFNDTNTYSFKVNKSNDTNVPVLNVDAFNRYVGINRNSPAYGLHVEDNAFITGNMAIRDGRLGIGVVSFPTDYKLQVNGPTLINDSAFITQKLGVGTTDAENYALKVVGDLRLTGNLYGNNAVFETTQWVSMQNSNIYYLGNVGIGTVPYNTNKLEIQGNSIISGNLGIGITNPSTRLHINDGYLIITGNNANIGIGTSTPIATLQVEGTSLLNGNVGIGTYEPLYKHHVHGMGYYSSNVTIDGLLTTRGNISSISDRSLKEDLKPIYNALDRVSYLTGYTYKRIDTNQRECGLIAQDVKEVLPEAVVNTPDSLLTVTYGNLASLFVQAIKEIKEEMNKLEQRIQLLESSNS